ncbi:integrase core domain-containing protein [Barnesiella intestinihominis]|uniref:integrase core domain-containing protein n=1 Tax=Barnesiella intestinihominis TaxID=487174 RepID=UPI00399168DC
MVQRERYNYSVCSTHRGYIERFNDSYRRAVLNAYIFRSIEELERVTQEWN